MCISGNAHTYTDDDAVCTDLIASVPLCEHSAQITVVEQLARKRALKTKYHHHWLEVETWAVHIGADTGASSMCILARDDTENHHTPAILIRVQIIAVSSVCSVVIAFSSFVAITEQRYRCARIHTYTQARQALRQRTQRNLKSVHNECEHGKGAQRYK